MYRFAAVALGALVLAAMTMPNAKAQDCGDEAGVALMVGVVSGEVQVPQYYGIGPGWVTTFHPALPQLPFLIPPGWQALYSQDGWSLLFDLVSPGGEADVTHLIGRTLAEGGPAEIGEAAILGDGFTEFCRFEIVQQPGGFPTAVVAAYGEGYVRMAVVHIYTADNWSVNTVAAPQAEFDAIVDGVLIPFREQLAHGGGHTTPCDDVNLNGVCDEQEPNWQ
jgi:hypothetical protein